MITEKNIVMLLTKGFPKKTRNFYDRYECAILKVDFFKFQMQRFVSKLAGPFLFTKMFESVMKIIIHVSETVE